MDHFELYQMIAEKIETEIDKIENRLESMEKNQNKQSNRTTELEVKVSGTIKLGLILLTAVVGVATKIIFY